MHWCSSNFQRWWPKMLIIAMVSLMFRDVLPLASVTLLADVHTALLPIWLAGASRVLVQWHDPISWHLHYFQAQEVPGLSSVLPFPELESAVSPGSAGTFSWEMLIFGLESGHYKFITTGLLSLPGLEINIFGGEKIVLSSYWWLQSKDYSF